MLSPANNTPWDDFWKELVACYPKPSQRATIANHSLAWNLLAEAFPAGPASITKGGLIQLREKLLASGLALETVRTRLRTIRTQCNMMVDSGILPASPFDRRRNGIIPTIPKVVRESKKRHLTVDEIRRMLAQADADCDAAIGIGAIFRTGRLRALLYTVAYTGLRSGEILYLRNQDIDWGGRLLSVTGEANRAKTEASIAKVGVHRKAMDVLQTWTMFLSAFGYSFVFPTSDGDRPWVNGTDAYRPAGQINALAERVGVPGGANLKMFRHSVATHLRNRFGASKEDVQAVLRHSTTETQRHYVHDDPENLRAKADLIDF